MTGFEPRSSGIVSNRSANCATTTSPKILILTTISQKGIPTYVVEAKMIFLLQDLATKRNEKQRNGGTHVQASKQCDQIGRFIGLWATF